MILNFIKNSRACLLLLVISVLFSCTPIKKVNYLNTGTNSANKSTGVSLGEYILEPGDMLYIKVQSLDDKTYKLFNSDWSATNTQTDLNLYIDSYTLSDSGYIVMPVAGKILLKGLTLQNAQKEIQKNINSYLKDANVIVKLSNYKITILGEVNRPGTYKIYDNNITLLEAIGLAGDMTVFGNRLNVMVLRKSQDNKIAYLDVTDINVINSEFFQLKPNDVIYIQPTVAKTLGFKEFPFSVLFASLTTIFTGITTVLVLINYLKK